MGRNNRQGMNDAMANLRRRTMSPTQALISGMEHADDENQPTNDDDKEETNDESQDGTSTFSEPNEEANTVDGEKVTESEQKHTDVTASTTTVDTKNADLDEKGSAQKSSTIVRSEQESKRTSGGKKGNRTGTSTATTHSSVQDASRFSNLKAKRGKQRVEDTHTRRTFMVRNDLIERLDSIAKGTHGFIMEFMNLAIEMALDEFENGGEDTEQ